MKSGGKWTSGGVRVARENSTRVRCFFVMKTRGCKQNVGSAGMACQGRARNRMLRKRWIVRNPAVGEDDVTQCIFERSFNAPWPLGPGCYQSSFTVVLLFIYLIYFPRKKHLTHLSHILSQIAAVRGFPVFVEETSSSFSNDAALFGFQVSNMILFLFFAASQRSHGSETVIWR